MSRHDELIDLERAFWDAAGDGDFYREHFLDDGVCVFSMGVLDKATTVGAIESAPPWQDVAFDDVRVVELAPHATALAYSAEARRAGDEAPYRVRVSSVYVHRDGAWRLALHQQTPAD